MKSKIIVAALIAVIGGMLSQSVYATAIITPDENGDPIVLEATQITENAEEKDAEQTAPSTKEEEEKAAFRKKRLAKKAEKVKKAKLKREKRLKAKSEKIAKAEENQKKKRK